MRTQCHGKPLEFEGNGRHRLVAKKLIFLSFFFVSLRGYLFVLPLRGLRADVSYPLARNAG